MTKAAVAHEMSSPMIAEEVTRTWLARTVVALIRSLRRTAANWAVERGPLVFVTSTASGNGASVVVIWASSCSVGAVVVPMVIGWVRSVVMWR